MVNPALLVTVGRLTLGLTRFVQQRDLLQTLVVPAQLSIGMGHLNVHERLAFLSRSSRRRGAMEKYGGGSNRGFGAL